ncbi:MAG TPA: FtsH protease activity modulator HflK [Armatimonadetes bacterium]|jgi:membrane protease subunit HflK|nr:FtsH protease activity modulator HflK [Armatimonadota bacterium]
MTDDNRRAITDSLDAAFRFLRWGAIVVLAAIALSGVTYVRSHEQAVVVRFGKLAGATAADQVHGPGILIAYPYLIDRIIRVPVRTVQEMEIADFAIGTAGAQPAAAEAQEQTDTEAGEQTAEQPSEAGATPENTTIDPTKMGYCVTGDQNIVHADVVVKLQISDPINYALYVKDPEAVVRSTVCEALTQAIGAKGVDSVLAEGKKDLAVAVRDRAQKRLDETNTGVQLAALEFREIVPPAAVAPDFEDVINAYVEKQTKVQEAQTYREQEVPKAQADRDRAISEAQAFAADRLARARGEAATFKSVLAEYRANPKVVRERLYREKVEKIIGGVGKRLLVPHKGSATRLILPAPSAADQSATPATPSAPAQGSATAPTKPQEQGER